MELILGVLGLVVSVAFGIPTLRAYKKSQRKIALSFGKIEGYSLFKDDINRLNIDVIYHEKPIKSNIILFKGELRNDGLLDIDESSIFTPLTIVTDEKYKWCEATIIDNHEGNKTSLSLVDENSLEFQWDLLKKGESIVFEALIEAPPGKLEDDVIDAIYDTISFRHRITNLKNIAKTTQIYQSRRKYKKAIIETNVASACIVVFALMFLFSGKLPTKYSILPSVQNIEYQISEEDSVIIGSIKPLRSGQISVITVGRNQNMTIEDFNRSHDIQQISRIQEKEHIDNAITIIFGAVMLLFGLMVLTINIAAKINKVPYKEKNKNEV